MVSKPGLMALSGGIVGGLFLQLFPASGSKFSKLPNAGDTTESQAEAASESSSGSAASSPYPSTSPSFPLFGSQFKNPHLQREVLGIFIGTRHDLEQLRQVSKHGYEKVTEAVQVLREEGRLKLRRRFQSAEELTGVMWLWRTPRFQSSMRDAYYDDFGVPADPFASEIRSMVERLAPKSSLSKEEIQLLQPEMRGEWSEETLEAFRQAAVLEYGPVDEWDVGDVEELTSEIFRCSRAYGDPYDEDPNHREYKAYHQRWPNMWRPSFTVTNWRTKGVRSMQRLFQQCGDFNQPLNWDTSTVEDMSLMFANAFSFNQALSWDVRKVKTMFKMFLGCAAFNHPAISRWQTDSLEVTIRQRNTIAVRISPSHTYVQILGIEWKRS